MAGYSGKTLADKLGWKPGMKLIAVNAPDNLDAILAPSPMDTALALRRTRDSDLLLVFMQVQLDLEKHFASSKTYLAKTGSLWAAWPKKASGIQTDLGEQIIREFGLALGLVDVKVCAIDDVWSGLKFVYRLKDRG